MIRNLLFDLGGVILNLNRRNCEQAFQDLGLANPGVFFGDYGQKGPFMLIESGRITPDEFHDAVRALIPGPVTDRQIDDAFIRFLGSIPVERLARLRELRKTYRIFLLSNTNAIMWDSKIADEFRHEGLNREDYFDGIVTSFEARALKPDTEIFRYAARTLGIDPTETLFFDDSQANCDAAAALGFNTAHVGPGVEFYDILKQRDLA